MKNLLTTAFLLVLFSVGAAADVVVLDGNDSLSGTLLRVSGGTLVFKTRLSGQIMAPMDTVRSLTTDKNHAVTLKNGATLYGRFAVREDRQVLVILGAEEARPLTLAEVTEAQALPATPAGQIPEAAPQEPEWSATGGLGVRYRDANTAGMEPVVGGEVRRTGPQTQIDAEFTLGTGTGDGRQGFAEGDIRVLGTPESGWGPYAEAGMDRDMNQALAFRGELGLGLWKSLMGGGPQSLQAMLGVAVSRERWRDAPGFQNGGTVYDTDLNARLGLRYFRLLTNRTTFEENLDLYADMMDNGALRGRSETALAFPLGDRLRLRLNLIIGYEDNPPFNGMRRWSGAVGAGMDMQF